MILSLLLFLSVAQLDTPRFTAREFARIGGRSGRGFPSEADPEFAFAPPSGAGLPYAQNLCAQLAPSEKVGTWECFNGDNTSSGWDGGTGQWSAIGSPTGAQTMPLCPNGPNCASVTRDVEPSATGRTTAAYASGTDSVTACWLGTIDAAATVAVASQSTGPTDQTISWYLEVVTGSGTNFYVSNGVGTLGIGAYGAVLPTLGAEHLFCGTWSSANGIRACMDGVCGSLTARAARQSLNAEVVAHGFHTTGATGPARTHAFFVTHTELGTARIAAIAHAVLADTPTGSKGEATPITRASVATCDDGNGHVSKLPNDRPCVAQGGLVVTGQGQDSVWPTEALDDARWFKQGIGVDAGIVTANYAVAPDGTLTADRLQLSATLAAGDSCDAYQSDNASVRRTGSVFIRSTDGVSTGTIDLCVFAVSWSCSPCAFTGTWSRCSYTHPSTSVGSSYLQIGNVTYHNGGTPRPAADVLLWGMNLVDADHLTSYIPAATAPVTRAVTKPRGPTLSDLASSGCVALTVTPMASTAFRVDSLVTAGTNARFLYTSAANNLAAWDGTNAVNINGFYTTAGVPYRLGSSWGGSQMTVKVITTGQQAVGIFTGNMSVGPLELLQSDWGAVGQDALLTNVVLDHNPSRCR